ncbi:MAG: methyltransferase domain-containing protein [Parcubacteria group bacterium]|nr:methyltransferase domain-containing protein [Parcubacteria group bacterium]
MFADPKKNVEQLELTPGMKVADLGSGSGFYTLAAAKAVGDKGRVYSIDIQKELLARLKNEAVRERLYNVEVVCGDLEKLGGTHIRDFSIDVGIISNILFQLKERDAFVGEVKRILKPGGMVLVVDWTDSFGGLGPQQGDIFPFNQARTLFEKNGFAYQKDISAGPHHYGAIFRKI